MSKITQPVGREIVVPHRVNSFTPGPEGPQGAAGPAGSAATIRIVLGDEVLFDVAAGDAKDATSICPAGSTVIAGRISMSIAACHVAVSRIGLTPNTWQGVGACPPGVGSSGNSVQAICLRTG